MASANYTPAHQAFYESVTREVQARQTASSFLDVGQAAFRTCVHSFMHHELSASEEKCVNAVAHKFVTVSTRASARFGELQAAAAHAERDKLERATAAFETSGR